LPSTVSSFNRRIKGSRITSVGRRGKFILIQLESKVALPHGRASDTRRRQEFQKPARKQGQRATQTNRQRNVVLLVHLRMTGKFLYLNADDELPRHSHAI